MAGSVFFAPGCCTCDPCASIVYCLTVASCCAGAIVGQAITITPAGGSPDSGVSDGAGEYCHTFDARPSSVQVATTYRGCTLTWVTSFIDCSHTQTVRFCWADVTLSPYSLDGGDLTGEQVSWIWHTRFGGDRHSSSCDSQPIHVRQVEGFSPYVPPVVTGCSDTIDWTGCPLSTSLLFGNVFHCDGTTLSNFLWECARDPGWCCETTTLEVGGLPYDGNSLWTGRDPCSGQALLGLCCAGCRAAADMAYQNMAFEPRKVQFDAALYYYWPNNGVSTRADVSLSLEVPYVCDAGRPCYFSGPITVSWPLGTYYCRVGGVWVPHTYSATSVRVRLRGDFPTAPYCQGTAEIEVLATDFAPGCADWLISGCGAAPPSGVRWVLADLGGCPQAVQTSSDWFVRCCDGPDGYGGVIPCDHHVDWTFERHPLRGSPPLCFDTGDGYGCPSRYIFGTATAVGPV